MRFRNVLCVFISFFCLTYAKAQTNLLLDTGKVGIGTTQPQSLLDIRGSGLTPENQPLLTLSTPNNSGIANGSLLGMLQWSADDNSSGRVREQTAYIRQRATSTWNATNSNSYIGFGIRQNNSTFLHDVLVIQNSGRVGIGIANPASLLHVNATAGASVIRISSGSGANSRIYFNEMDTILWNIGSIGSSNKFSIYDGSKSSVILERGAPEAAIYLSSNGKIGFGTSVPSANLEVLNKSGSSTALSPATIKIRSTTKGSNWDMVNSWANLDFHNDDSDGVGNAVRARIGAYMTAANGSRSGLKFYTSPSSGAGDVVERMVISSTGRVGIGTSNPTQLLEVAGTIRANEVKVEAQWWDVVFEPEYDLMPVNDLRVFVQQHKHLPDIPSEAEVAANGVDVGNMTGLLLKKMEELTLYMLQQQEQIDSLLKLTEELKQENQRLNQQLSDQ